ncbi:NAD(P)-binding protein [Ramicandelaber brevisporus]|nr:NAD(P)-binding protein [Ramicandelaber brevisporus]
MLARNAPSTTRVLAQASAQQQKRWVHGVKIVPKTLKPAVSAGAGGRSSLSGHTATVFGCTGFLGRYIVNRLARRGTNVVIPFRGEEDNKRHLKQMGDLGQVVPLEFDIRNEDQIAEVVRHSDIVYNLIGANYPTKNFTFESVHVAGAKRIAEISQACGVARLVHVSALGANPQSTSEFLKTKAIGEQVVREAFPDATIVRPAVIYGHEDNFLQWYANFKNLLFTVRGADALMRPVCVSDVAYALDQMMYSDATVGKTVELFGNEQFKQSEVIDLVSKMLRQKVFTMALPKDVYKYGANLLQYSPYRHLSPDEVERLTIDALPSGEQGVLTFQELGITPRALEPNLLQYIRHRRNADNYHEPMEQNKNLDFREHTVPGVWTKNHTTF